MKSRIHKVIILMFDVLNPGSSKVLQQGIDETLFEKVDRFFHSGACNSNCDVNSHVH